MTKTLSQPAHVGSIPQRMPGFPIRRVLIGALLVVALAATAVLVVGVTGSETEPQLTVGQLADAARWTAMAESKPGVLTPGQLADAARWTAMAESKPGVLTPGQLADAARWTAMAESKPGVLTPGQLADAARLTAQAESFGVVGADGLTRGQRADAARLRALADAIE